MKTKKRTSSPVSRRTLLKTMGAAALYAPVANLLRVPIAEAAPAVAPLRLILIFERDHVQQAFSYPRSVDAQGIATTTPASPGAAFSLDFPYSVLAPYSPYKNKMMIFRGLHRVDAMQNAINGHYSAGTTFTGARCTYPASGAQTTSRPSLDQYLHSRMKTVSGSLLSPMVMGVMLSSDPGISFTGQANSAPVPSVVNPLSVFNTYFGAYTSTPTTGANPQLQRRNAAFNVAMSQLSALRARLSSREGAILDQHQSAMNSLYQQINSSGPAGASCTPPAKATIVNSPSLAYGNMNTVFQNINSLITQSFACDITRFAAISFDEPIPDQNPSCVSQIDNQFDNNLTRANFINTGEGNYHGRATHQSTGALTSDPLSGDLLVSAYQLYFQRKVASLMASLAATPDPYAPGQTLLDNTIILSANENNYQEQWRNGTTIQGFDPHSYADGKFIMLGGCGGYFQMGRILEGTPRIIPYNAPPGTPVGGQGAGANNASYYTGMPHNALLTTIVNAFEHNAKQFNPAFVPQYLSWFGDPSFQTFNGKTWGQMNLGQTAF